MAIENKVIISVAVHILVIVLCIVALATPVSSVNQIDIYMNKVCMGNKCQNTTDQVDNDIQSLLTALFAFLIMFIILLVISVILMFTHKVAHKYLCIVLLVFGIITLGLDGGVMSKISNNNLPFGPSVILALIASVIFVLYKGSRMLKLF